MPCPVELGHGRRHGKSVFIIVIVISPLTARFVGAPQMILQPVFSIFPCSLGLAELQACPFPDVVMSNEDTDIVCYRQATKQEIF